MPRSKRRGPGRPPLPRGSAAEVRFELLVTKERRQQWQAAADREGLTVSKWLQAAAELAIARGSTR